MMPWSLLRFHGAMLWVTLRAGWQFFYPPRKHTLGIILPVKRIIPAPSRQLIQHYLNWCDASDRYPDTLPPHMVSQWGLPLVAHLLFQTPFRMSRVLNQGITLDVHGALPRNQPLHCMAFIQSVREESERTLISVTLQTGTAEHTNLVAATVHMVIIHRRKNGKKKMNVRGRNGIWAPIGHWRASESDGLRFALISGDFNPIHWLSLAGRLSVLKNKILQGFGSFARTYEQLAKMPVKQIDVRFLRPVKLPSEILRVERSVEEQSTGRDPARVRIRLLGADDQIHLAGTVIFC